MRQGLLLYHPGVAVQNIRALRSVISRYTDQHTNIHHDMNRLFAGKIAALLLAAAALIALPGCGQGEDPEPQALTVPSGVTLQSFTSNSLTFSWNAVPGAASYSYKLANNSGVTLQQSSTTQTSVTISSLDKGTTYKFAVQASGSGQQSAYSDFVSGTPADNGGTANPSLGLPSWEEADGLARAFPGAEGGGMYATGGRVPGGTLYRVTNLNDNGSGSLREGLKAGNRTIIFDVGGRIELQSTLEIKYDNVTIAGQTAPGGGICLSNYSLVVKANNVIIRFIRSRMGDEKQTEDDAMWGRWQKNVIIDHCSMSWSTDECSSFYANENFTMQWCVLSESLRNSKHDKGTHGYGAIWGGVNASYHHNLLAHHDSRNPRFDGGDVYKPYSSNTAYGASDRRVDYRNCVVYNFSNEPAYGGEAQNINFTGNYYKAGPASTGGPGPNAKGEAQGIKNRLYFYKVNGVKSAGTPSTDVDFGCPNIFMDNTNVFDHPTATTTLNSDNWSGVIYATAGNASGQVGATTYTKLTTRVGIAPGGVAARVTNHTAAKAFDQVLLYAGANLSRDEVDTRAVNDTRNRTATIAAGSNGSVNGYIDSQTDAGGWPAYAPGTKKTDTDNDGIPDDWEDLFGLNKNSAADAMAKTLDPRGRYTNLELYHHWLVKDIIAAQVADGTYLTQN